MKLALALLLLVGTLLILLSVIPTMKICRSDKRFGWRALFALILLFFLGYLFFLFLLINKESVEQIDIIVSLILLGGGGFVFLVIRLSLASITQAQKLAKKERYKALHDPLTGLPNRKLFSINVKKTIKFSKKNNNTFSVLMIDLNRFKEINDTLGHDIGDGVLVEISKRFNQIINKEQIVARLGGDEFALIIPDADNKQVISVCKALHESLNPLILVKHYALTVDMSVGVAMYPEHGTDIRMLLKNSDVAMYQSKKDKVRSVVYDEYLNRDSLRRLELISAIKQALVNHDFELYYQPIINTKNNKVRGVEALIRWPESGIGPEEFIPLAEEVNIIKEITLWVLNEALEQVKKWSHDYPSLQVNINISVLDLRDINFPNQVSALLDSFAVPAKMLVFEITESAMMLDIERVIKVINELSELGINFAVDDFGTGFSSLSLLRELPSNVIKIDRSFISTMQSEKDNAAIVQATIDLAHSIRRKTVAEGVENKKIAALLLNMGCDYLQGNTISRPLNRNETELWLAQHYFGSVTLLNE
jgi:diguanylate cyclase (GGDEF)-like protein